MSALTQKCIICEQSNIPYHNGHIVIPICDGCRKAIKSMIMTKSEAPTAMNEKVNEWEIVALDESFHLNDTNTPDLYFKAAVERGAIIKSVRRVSDGEVFTVGDNFRVHPGIHLHKIHLFRIDGNALAVLAEDFPKYTYYLPHLIKANRKELFVTSDGVSIYEGSQYWETDGVNIWHWETRTKEYPHPDKTIFSTREKAEEYILMNKPCLSVNDCLFLTVGENIHVKKLQDKLIEIAKQKQA